MPAPPVAVDPEFRSDSMRVVRREGDVVVRRTSWWSPAVHDLLRHLERQGFPESVRLLGLDADGNERLALIEGVGGMEAWRRIVPVAGLREYARLIRRYHDAVRDYAPPADAEWMIGRRALAPDEIVTHGDVGPWNTVWRGDRAIGLIDWDQAAPRPGLHDVAYALEYAVPFRSDEDAMAQIGFPAPPDRAARLRAFAAAYGLPGTDGLVDAVLAEQEETLRANVAVAARGLEPHASWIADGFVAAQQRRIDWTAANRHLFA
ncbi:phosphotransferase [uncultured Amnibacterium sp.]|uniref:phosphotransferase n=1 Tax=uncultured Amnibacterium sp. TaxID=1631851 RepID=UPI0035CAC53C